MWLPPSSREHFLQLYSVEAAQTHLEKPVGPKYPRYAKVVQTARNIAERDPVQEESVMQPIHYEGASFCLQGRKPSSAEVWSEGQCLQVLKRSNWPCG